MNQVHFTFTVNVKSFLSLIVLSLALVMLDGCRQQSAEVGLSFETIEQDWHPPLGKNLWSGHEPKLLVIAGEGDLVEAGNFVSGGATAALSSLDFTQYVAVLAFQGWLPEFYNGFNIERIVRRGRDIDIFAELGITHGGAAVSSPYHLVRVEKEGGKWQGDFTFRLYFDEDKKASAEVIYHFP